MQGGNERGKWVWFFWWGLAVVVVVVVVGMPPRSRQGPALVRS